MKLRDAPNFGRFVRLRKTGETCRWIAYDPESETLVVKLRSGVSFPAPQRDLDPVTPDEEKELLQSEHDNKS